MDTSGEAYWKATLTLIAQVLAVWFFVSFGCGILFADALNSMSLGGYPLGFWFAQQGSMCVLVILSYGYKRLIGKLDANIDINED